MSDAGFNAEQKLEQAEKFAAWAEQLRQNVRMEKGGVDLPERGTGQPYAITMHLERIELKALRYWKRQFKFNGTDGQLALWILGVAMQRPKALEKQMDVFFSHCIERGLEQGEYLTEALQGIGCYAGKGGAL